MRIFILPFTFRKFFSSKKRVSGIDESLMKQVEVLTSLGHDVKVFLSFSDVDDTRFDLYSSDVESFTQDSYKQNKFAVLHALEKSISAFKPDVVLSNFSMNKLVYNALLKHEIPVLYLSHSLPGQFADIGTGLYLKSFLDLGHSFGGVSDYHVSRLKKFYSISRNDWFGPLDIEADCVVPSSYASPEEVVSASKVIRHVSACNPKKGTFLIHDNAYGSDFETEVFTTVNYIGGGETEYYLKNKDKFIGDEKRRTNYDVPHREIMGRLRDSSSFFVGFSQYDTFTITSIEALQKGIPLMIYGKNEVHPAINFVETHMREYVSFFTSKKQFMDIAERYHKMTIDDRRALAESCLKVMGKESYGTTLVDALEKVIAKYNATKKFGLEEFFV